MPGADREGIVVAVSAVVAFVVGALAHRESVAYWFTASDTVPMIESSRVTGSGDLVALFAEPMMAGTRFVEFALFFRPLASLSYALDYALWGLDPAGYHLTTILLHGAAAATATVAIVVVTRRRLAGAIGGLLFAGHPITAEVVPSAVRRHDVIMTVFLLIALVLFVRSRRADDGRSALVGSLACYLFALLSKELALVFPGMVVAWVALGRDRPWSRPALSSATRAVAPFLAVTAGMVAVRVAVLGGLGGYKRHPVPSAAEVVLIFVEYPLSMGYPHAVVGMGTLPGAGAEWRLVLGGMAVVGGIVLIAVGSAVARRAIATRSQDATATTTDVATDGPSSVTTDGPSSVARDGSTGVATVAALATAAALIAIPLAIAFEPWVISTVPVLYDPDELSIVRAYLRPSSAIVGLLLVATVVTVGIWAATDRSSSLRPHDRRSLAFFGIWLIGPMVLFFPAGNYTFRGGYGSLAPAMGALGLLLAVGFEGFRSAAGRNGEGPPWRRVSAADVALVGVAVLLIVPLVATTPLVHQYEGWATSGRVNEATLTGVQNATDGAPPEADVEVDGMLRIVADRGCSFPQAKTLQFARPGTVEAWLRLHGEDRRATSRDDRILPGNPTRVWVTGGRNGTNVTASVQYAETDPGACLRTPWERY